MSFLALIPLIVTAMEVFKRFIPAKHKDVVVPIMAVGTGVGMSWFTGGHEAGMDAITQGLAGAAAAIGTYTGSKSLGGKLLGTK